MEERAHGAIIPRLGSPRPTALWAPRLTRPAREPKLREASEPLCAKSRTCRPARRLLPALRLLAGQRPRGRAPGSALLLGRGAGAGPALLGPTRRDRALPGRHGALRRRPLRGAAGAAGRATRPDGGGRRRLPGGPGGARPRGAARE